MRTREEQIEKITEAMKDYTLLHTYGDDGHGYPLIDALTPDGRTVDVGESECGELDAELYDSVIAPHILEAERRAEQRVRAEIARDSERLDWLSDGQHELAVFDSIGVVVTDDSGETHIHEDIRQAIDAAREVG